MNTENAFQVPKTFNDWREARRFRAWELHEKGWSQTRVAEALGVTGGAVSQWLKTVREEGLRGLLSRLSKRGPKSRLAQPNRARLPQLLECGAEAYGFLGDVWTCGRVGKVIQQEYGVAYSERHVGRLLDEIGWTRQKPVARADQRDAEANAHGHTEDFPELKKKPPGKNEPVCL
ncbi:MAG: winged helix-turn-helix domain-containing protein [Anaerolineales bacterium]|nr:winged helix-turn-helix domain-containing protein [Anaerolineales bacterium]